MGKTNCPYCGNNPVPHFIFWYHESLNILLTPIRQWLLYNVFANRFRRQGFGQTAGRWFFNLGRALGIVRLRGDIEKCKVRRAQVLWEEAKKRGIKMREILLLGKPFDCYLAEMPVDVSSNRSRALLFSGLPRPSNYNHAIVDRMDDKWIFKKIMMAHSLPVAAGASCWNFWQAKQVLKRIDDRYKATDTRYQIIDNGYQITDNSGDPALLTPNTSRLVSSTSPLTPAIVKPRTGSRGRHSTTFVSSISDLKKAFKAAKQLCFWVMVEEQLFGPVYRATVINYKLEGVLRGDPPQITGDGEHTIGELVILKNNLPHPGVKDIVIDEGVKFFLQKQGLNLSSTLEKGSTVNLSEKIGVNYGGSSSEDFEICHPDNKELFVQAARAVGDPILGFDFIIADITKSWKEQKCGFIEVNSLPFINLHHDPLLGKPRNVAAAVWDMVGAS